MTPHHTGPIPGPPENTPEWLAVRHYDPERVERPVVIGASDAAAACGMSHYNTPLDIYLRCRGEIEEQERPKEVRDRMRRGRRFQNVILKEYGEDRNVAVWEPERMYFHPALSWMAATPDGISFATTTFPGSDYLVECKGTTPAMFSQLAAMETNRYGEEGTDVVPDEVLFQTQQQMEVMAMDRCDVVVFFGLFVMRVYPVQRNDTLIDAIKDAEQELVERIIDGRPPEPHWQHPNTRALISQVHGLRANSVVQLGEAELSLWLKYQEYGEQIKTLETSKEECRNRLMWSMGDAEIGRFPLGTKELRRVVVKDSLVTDDDVAKLAARIGEVKRRGYEKILERKATQ